MCYFRFCWWQSVCAHQPYLRLPIRHASWVRPALAAYARGSLGAESVAVDNEFSGIMSIGQLYMGDLASVSYPSLNQRQINARGVDLTLV